MEILLSCIMWYVIIGLCVFIWLIIDDYLTIEKYSIDYFYYNKIQPFDCKVTLLMSTLWLILLIVFTIIFARQYILKKD